MKIQIEATNVIVNFDGVECRLWEGVTADGTRCKVMVYCIAVHDDEDSSQFERELQEKMPPAQPAIDIRHAF